MQYANNPDGHGHPSGSNTGTDTQRVSTVERMTGGVLASAPHQATYRHLLIYIYIYIYYIHTIHRRTS